MGGKYKKTLRSEKAKTKLKGAKLPKGLNVTKTDFKVKKIVIKEQISGTVNVDQNVKEVLSRLNHHNTGMKLTALGNLKDIVKVRAEGLSRHLGQILQGISASCLDIEQSVRKESLKILDILLLNQTNEAIQPFFGVVASYLNCAMTHIRPGVQEDSLLLLDVLMKNVPSLIANICDSVFKNFLDMISKSKESGAKERVLTTNTNKIKTAKWREKVLQRLFGMLTIILNLKKKMHTLEDNHKDFIFNTNEKVYIPLIRAYEEDINEVDIFKNRTGEKLNARDEEKRLAEQVNSLPGLLSHSWIEVRPVDDKFGMEDVNCVLSDDAYSTLKIILDIFECLWELVCLWEESVRGSGASKTFIKVVADDFLHFYKGFPYEYNFSGKDSRKSGQSNKLVEINCIQQNLTLVYLFCTLLNKHIRSHSKIAQRSLEFLFKNLQSDYNKNGNDVHWERAIRAVLFQNGKLFLSISSKATNDLLQKVLIIEKQVSNRTNHESIFFTLLCDIILDTNLCNLYGEAQFNDWLSELPKLLKHSSIHRQTLERFTNLAKRRNLVFLNALKSVAEDVSNGINEMNFVGYSNQSEGKRSMENLLIWTTIC